MDKVSIGMNAGIVWRVVRNHGPLVGYKELKKASGLSDRDLNAAIGWLARENKIEFATNPDDDSDLFCVELNVYF